MPQNKSSLSMRQRAIFQAVWNLGKEEIEKLDKFFLLHDTWEDMQHDLSYSEENICFYLNHDGADYQVYFLHPLPKVKKAADLGLSFRCNYRSGMHIVLVKEWKEEPFAIPANQDASKG